MPPLNEYASAIREKLRTGVAQEHAYRPALESLLRGLDPRVNPVNEPARIRCGAPDFIVLRGEMPQGHIECKDLDTDLRKEEKKDQLKRYLQALPNLVLTDYVRFRWYVEGKLRDEAALGELREGKLHTTDTGAAALESLLRRFLERDAPIAGTAKELARRMAHLAHMMREATVAVLHAEGDRGTLHGQLDAFRAVLLPELSEAGFADMYAQTIAYGVFAARCYHGRAAGSAPFTRQAAEWHLPPTNPFLRGVFRHIAGPDLDSRIAWIVDDLAVLLGRADMGNVLEDFARKTGREDPVVHFYETFLREYDPKLREVRGVYYTPEPVVSYIVRSVDHILRTDFGLKDGLADPTVYILDPACGTGTFLYFTIQSIYQTVAGKYGDAAWPTYVQQSLLPRVFGFELLMAPYTIAHMKLAMLLGDLGYDFPDGQRLHIYLTNTLEEAAARSEVMFAQFIADEANAAAGIKRDKPIMVVMGNPPYSVRSANHGDWIEREMEYYKGTVRAQETQIQALSNDYVKFIRFAHWRIARTGSGVVGLITDNSWLDGPLFRDMRGKIVQDFGRVAVLNLHGKSWNRERAPDGSADKNVFDIKQGVAVGVMSRTPRHAGACSATYGDLWGSREAKAEALWALRCDTACGQALTPAGPQWLLVPTDEALAPEYRGGAELLDIFGTGRRKQDTHVAYGAGLVTQQDQFAIAFDRETLAANVAALLDGGKSEADLRARFRLCTTKQWDFRLARKRLPGVDVEALTRSCLYRPFDRRYTVYHRDVTTILREKIMRHLMGGPNLALVTTRRVTRPPFDNVFVTDRIVEYKCASHDRNSIVFPLYVLADGDILSPRGSRRANLSPAFTCDVSTKLGLAFIADGEGDLSATFGPEDVFHYIYAVLHSPTYRERYTAFLMRDFPRIPLTSDLGVFRALCGLGRELVALHLMQSPRLEEGPAPFEGDGDGEIERVRYDDQNRRVYVNKTQYFAAVEPAVFEFCVGGYQVLDKWLKDRKGRRLTFEDIRHYGRIVVALRETMRLMAEVDAAIPAWPMS